MKYDHSEVIRLYKLGCKLQVKGVIDWYDIANPSFLSTAQYRVWDSSIAEFVTSVPVRGIFLIRRINGDSYDLKRPNQIGQVVFPSYQEAKKALTEYLDGNIMCNQGSDPEFLILEVKGKTTCTIHFEHIDYGDVS